MRIFLMAFCLTCCSLIAAAQAQFIPGYIVKNSGDTVHGYIESVPNYQLTERINFKNQIEAKNAESFTLGEINSFAFENGILFRAIEYKDALNFYLTKKEFAKLLVTGYFDLYAIEREVHSYYYIKNEKDTG